MRFAYASQAACVSGGGSDDFSEARLPSENTFFEGSGSRLQPSPSGYNDARLREGAFPEGAARVSLRMRLKTQNPWCTTSFGTSGYEIPDQR